MDELNSIDQAISSDYTVEVPEEIEPTESYEKNK
jgi:hypothetical protein